MTGLEPLSAIEPPDGSGPPRPWSAQDFTPGLAIGLLVMQPTPFCNIACDYCYLAQRDTARFMAMDVVEATIRNALDSGLLGRELDVVWHAGEPLAAPRDFYDEAIECIGAIAGSAIRIRHSVQTNGLLIDEDWCRLFLRHRVRVGVSIDGPARVHDRHRRTRSGGPTHARVVRGIELLRRFGVEHDAIAVVTGDSLGCADEIVDFFLELGIGDVGFNVDEQEGINGTSTLADRDERVLAFFERVFERAAAIPERLRVRELIDALDRVARGLPVRAVRGRPLPDNPQVMPFATTTVDWAGGFSCFSPELIDQHDPRLGSFVWGNVLRDSMIGALGSEHFGGVFDDILAGVAACRTECDHFALCGGGAPVNKLNERGSLRVAETRYCRQTIKAPIALALAALESELGTAAR